MLAPIRGTLQGLMRLALRRKRPAPGRPTILDVLAGKIAGLEPGAEISIAANGFADAEALFDLALRLRLREPLPATLHLRFAALSGAEPEGAADPATLRERLAAGSPFREIVFHAADPHMAERVAAASGIRPLVDGDAEPDSGGASGAATARCDSFGPLALVISALWGAVGSRVVIDAQVRHLLGRGFRVAQVFVDHHPREGAAGKARIEALLRESLANGRAHHHLVALREPDREGAARLAQDPAFAAASPLARTVMMLAGARPLDPDGTEWLGAQARLAIVNHAMHMGFAERITRAPIVLETHDIFARLLDVHGIPHYVARGPDSTALRHAEEAALWRRAAACINLSPEEHALVAPHTRVSAFVRPYAARPAAPARPWREAVRANRLPARFAAVDRFDLMLWGAWHQGNIESISWFLEQVVRRHPRLARASVLLVGRVVNGLHPALLDRANVLAARHVDRIDDCFARAGVLVIPDRRGTGLSMKTMEACLRGKAFAATAAALRGLDLADAGYRGHDDADAMAGDVAALLESAALREERAALAARIAARNYSPARHAQAWDDILRAVLGADTRQDGSAKGGVSPGGRSTAKASSVIETSA